MKQQISKRRGIPHIRHTLEQFNRGIITTEEAMIDLDISRSRLFELRRQWLACLRRGEEWAPGVSGGDHHPPWPTDSVGFLRDALSCKPPYSYAFAASEMERLTRFKADRAQVRLWAIRNGLAHASPREVRDRHWRRFQRSSIGELWQMDSTPFPWLGPGTPQLPMLNMLDDCSRMQTGGTVYAAETLDAYIHFCKTSFETFGMPLQIYVDMATFFKSPLEDGTTKLKSRLAFYGISLVYANTPQAKGKIERLHQVWQGRLPPYFAKNGAPEGLEEANSSIWELIQWRNERETHRETGMTAREAWDKAKQEGMDKLRPVPKCPWWEYVWSRMDTAIVRPRGKVRIGADEVSVSATQGAKVVLCTHVDGYHTILLDKPTKDKMPTVIFTDRPAKKQTTENVKILF